MKAVSAHVHSIFPNEDFLDLKPYQYGWEECAPLHSFGPFVRNHYLFHYIMSGQGTLFSHSANGDIHEYHLSAGQGFLICPGQINLYTADEQEPWKYLGSAPQPRQDKQQKHKAKQSESGPQG